MATVATERKVFVGGEWVETGDWIEVRSPYSGEVVGRVAKAGAAETRRAVDAAERAMAEPLPAHKRAEILVRVAGYLGRRHDEVARTISDQAGEGKLAFTLRVPIGVVGAISPFNFPLNLVAHKLAPALAAGCAVVLKPASQTPLSALLLAELDEEATKLAANAFSFAGQSCISVQRIYVERAAYDGFLERFLPKVEALRVGDPADEETDVGPVIDDDARERILDWIEEARSAGARILTGGDLDGELVRPTVIGNAAPDLKVSCEEVFGPVCTVNAVDSLDEAVELANGTPYGLQAGVFTRGLREALDLARRLEFGGVTINEAPTFRADQMPYGGVKGSGNTREGPAYAVRELTEERLVVVDL